MGVFRATLTRARGPLDLHKMDILARLKAQSNRPLSEAVCLPHFNDFTAVNEVNEIHKALLTLPFIQLTVESIR